MSTFTLLQKIPLTALLVPGTTLFATSAMADVLEGDFENGGGSICI